MSAELTHPRADFDWAAVGRKAVRLLRPGSLIAATAGLLAPGLVLGPPIDPAVFVLAGSRIRDGFMPYRDLWDHKPPGGYLLNALGQAVLPWLDAWLVSWLLTVVFTAVAVLVVDDLLRRRLSAGASWGWSLLFCACVACFPVAVGGGLTESFALLPLVAATWAVAVLPRSWRTAAAVGCALGCACVFSLQALPAAAVLSGAAVWDSDWPAHLARRSIALLAGVALLPLAVIGWLAAGGALGDAVDQVLTYNAAYRGSGSQLLVLLPLAALLLMFLAIPVGVALVRMVSRPRAIDRLDWVCLAWCVIYAAYIAYQGRIFLHYLIPMIPPLVVLASEGMQVLWARITSPSPSVRKIAIGLCAVAGVALVISSDVAVQLSGIAMAQASDARQVVDATDDWIEANTPQSATIFIWGNDPAVYLGSARAPYDRYVDLFPLVTAGYSSADQAAAVLESWQASPPALIVESPASVPMLRPSNDAADAKGGDVDYLGSLRAFARAHYHLAVSFGALDDFNDVYVYVAPS